MPTSVKFIRSDKGIVNPDDASRVLEAVLKDNKNQKDRIDKLVANLTDLHTNYNALVAAITGQAAVPNVTEHAAAALTATESPALELTD